jgi:hypothetical protein
LISQLNLEFAMDRSFASVRSRPPNRGLNIEKFAAVAKRIRPNIATLAVMEPCSSALSAKLAELETALGGNGIAAELICLQDQDIDPSPILPNGRQFSVRLG